jgi:hypothetical protein
MPMDQAAIPLFPIWAHADGLPTVAVWLADDRRI